MLGYFGLSQNKSESFPFTAVNEAETQEIEIVSATLAVAVSLC